MKKILKLSEANLVKLIKSIIKEQETKYDIIDKTVGEVFPNINGVYAISNRIIVYSKFFPATETFDAVGNARKYLKEEGYENGSMYMNYPIPFMLRGKTGIDEDGDTIITTKHGEERPLIITKFDRLGKKNWEEMDGVIISEDFRNGDVYLLFFNFPE
jgi:hypothetical protein